MLAIEQKFLYRLDSGSEFLIFITYSFFVLIDRWVAQLLFSVFFAETDDKQSTEV